MEVCCVTCYAQSQMKSAAELESRPSTESQLLAWEWKLPAQSSSAAWYWFVKINGPLLKPHEMRKGLTEAE